MGKRKTVNGIPVPEGLTDAEYMRARRSDNTLKELMAMGKKPDKKWLRMIQDSINYVKVYLLLGFMFAQPIILLKTAQLLL